MEYCRVLMSSCGDMDNVIEALRLGAFDTDN